MLSVNVKQRVYVKFSVKFGKSTTETYGLLKKVYGDVYLVLKFKKGAEEIGDDQRPGHPSTPKTEANIEKVGEIVRQNRCLSI